MLQNMTGVSFAKFLREVFLYPEIILFHYLMQLLKRGLLIRTAPPCNSRARITTECYHSLYKKINKIIFKNEKKHDGKNYNILL